MKFGIKELKNREARRLLLGWILCYPMLKAFLDNNIHKVKVPADRSLTLTEAQLEWVKEVKIAAADRLAYQAFRKDDLYHLVGFLISQRTRNNGGGGGVSGGPKANLTR